MFATAIDREPIGRGPWASLSKDRVMAVTRWLINSCASAVELSCERSVLAFCSSTAAANNDTEGCADPSSDRHIPHASVDDRNFSRSSRPSPVAVARTMACSSAATALPSQSVGDCGGVGENGLLGADMNDRWSHRRPPPSAEPSSKQDLTEPVNHGCVRGAGRIICLLLGRSRVFAAGQSVSWRTTSGRLHLASYALLGGCTTVAGVRWLNFSRIFRIGGCESHYEI